MTRDIEERKGSAQDGCMLQCTVPALRLERSNVMIDVTVTVRRRNEDGMIHLWSVSLSGSGSHCYCKPQGYRATEVPCVFPTKLLNCPIQCKSYRVHWQLACSGSALVRLGKARK